VLSVAMLVYAVTPEIAAMTQRNVATMLRNTAGPLDLRVFINGGPPVAFERDERLTVIYQADRSSIAHAYNLAFSHAEGNVYACVHNDVEVPPGWDSLLNDGGPGIAFPEVIEDAQDCAERGIGLTKPYFPPGSCFALPRALYEELGGFDEMYEDCHFEDTDLWQRALDAGYPLRRVALRVVHGRGKTRTELPDRGNGAFARNRGVYIGKFRRSDGSVPLPTLQGVTP